MDAAETVREYYGALRAGEPLSPYFAEREDVVKFGITERLTGYEAIEAGLREQTRHTTDWTVDSRRLIVGDRGDAPTASNGPETAWFSDDVYLAWTDTREGRRHEYDSRWSGTLLAEDGDWRFVGMHVSAPQ